MLVSALASSATLPVHFKDLLNVRTYRYITLAYEEEDSEDAIAHYTDLFTELGFTQGLTGDGYGGPCSIIDGFYKSGYKDESQLCMVPIDRSEACVIELVACNNGEEADYGFISVNIILYDEQNANDLLKEITRAGFKLTDSSTYESFELRVYTRCDAVVYYSKNIDNTYGFTLTSPEVDTAE